MMFREHDLAPVIGPLLLFPLLRVLAGALLATRSEREQKNFHEPK